jgi:hypothetical protein
MVTHDQTPASNFDGGGVLWHPRQKQDLEEREPRIAQMTTNIEQMNMNIQKMRKDFEMDDRKYRLENRKFLVGIVLGMLSAVATGVGSTVAVMNYLDHHYTPGSQYQVRP